MSLEIIVRLVSKVWTGEKRGGGATGVCERERVCVCVLVCECVQEKNVRTDAHTHRRLHVR